MGKVGKVIKPYYQDDYATIYHGDCLDILPELPKVDLIISDPPYYKTKGKFDFIWPNFDSYLLDVEKWAKQLAHNSKDNATLFCFGGAKKIAYSQIIFDKYFRLLNSLVWNKGSFMGLEESKLLRSFAPCTERILLYENRNQKTGGEIVFEKFLKPKNPFSKYLLHEFKRANMTIKQIAKLFPSKTGRLTGCVSNWLNGDNVITEEQYKKIKSYLNGEYLRKEYEELRKEYEELRKEYEELRRPFNNIYNYQEILNFKNDAGKNVNIDHDTVKPIGLIRHLIEICSKKGNTIIDPFMGSGTTLRAAKDLQRKAIGIEIEEKYCEIAAQRLSQEVLDFC